MPDYRRNRVPGGTFFFPVNLLDRRSVSCRCLGVLPDHMHCLWSLPEGDADFPGRWRAIKIAFAKSLPTVEPRSVAMTSRGERGISQRRYWEHTIRDQRDFARHFDYIHFNPIKHGLVEHPADWPYSTFRRCVASGMYPSDWAGAGDEPARAGERP